MAKTPTYKSGKGKHKDSADKRSLNPVHQNEQPPEQQTTQPNDRDPRRGIGNYQEAGQHARQ